MKKRNSVPAFNRRGVSLIELVVASLIGAVSFSGSMVLYSSLDERSKATDADRSLASVSQSLRDPLSKDVKQAWLDLIHGACTTGGVTIPFTASSGGEFKVTLINSHQIDLMTSVAHGRHGARRPTEFRNALAALKAQFGPQANEKCSDPIVTTDSRFSEIGPSAYNQALCRCALANTFYGTMNLPVATVDTQQGLYACALIESNGASSSSQNAITLNTTSVIAEGTQSFFGISDNLPRTCGQIVATPGDKVFSRFTYNVTLKEIAGRAHRVFGALITE
jgi:hypothetical protein